MNHNNKSFLKKIKILFSFKQRLYLFLLFLGAFVVSATETIGLGSIAGFVMLLTDPTILTNKLPEGLLKHYIVNKDLSQLAIISAACLTLIFIIKNFIVIIFHYCEIQIKRNFVVNLGRLLYSYYLTRPYIFHLQNNPAKLLNSIITEVNRTTRFIFSFVLCFREILVVLSLLATLFFIDAKISFLIFLLMSFTSAIFYSFTQKKISEVGIKERKHSEKMLKHLSQGLGGIKILKLFGNQDFFVHKFFVENDRRIRQQIYHTFIQRLPRLFLEVLAVLTVTLTTLFFILDGRSIISVIPILTLLSLIVIRTVPAFININMGIMDLQYNKSSINNLVNDLSKYHDGKKDFQLNNSNINNVKNLKNITLDSISYRYPNSQTDVLKNVSLEIKSNQMVGIIGSSGAGKSTLVDLILGLLKPTGGVIKINDLNINKNLSNLQKLVGYVPQDIYLTDDSIKQNIAFGLYENEIDEKKVFESLKSSQLLNFVKTLPNELETIVGDRGVRLSGGQKQRIGVARALYNNPKILIMDEATSSLDNETEKKLIDDIIALKKDKIIILIAHRLSTLSNCDELFILDQGMLIDHGSIDDLVVRHKNLYPFLKKKLTSHTP